MLDNHTYNLMKQLVQEHKSLWRIKNSYMNEAGDQDSKKFWEGLEQQKENVISELTELVKKNLDKS